MEKVLHIKTIEDFERILFERPEWKERIRKLILTEELINLPAEFNRFARDEIKSIEKKVDNNSSDLKVLRQDVEVLREDVEILKEDVTVLKQDVAELKKDVEILKQDVAVLKQDVAELKKDVAELKDTIAELKGEFLELRVRDRIGAFLGKLFSKIRLIDFSDFADILYEAKEKGKIEEKEIYEALKIDAIAEAYMRKPEKKKIYLAIEISYVVDKKDIERAASRAEIVSKAYEIECIPIALGKKTTKGAQSLSDRLTVLVI